MPDKTSKEFYVCSCFFKDNFFVKELGKHVTYLNDEQFIADYGDIIEKLGLQNTTNEILYKIHTEVTRRKQLGSELIDRKGLINQKYSKLHPDIFILKDDHFQPSFLKLVEKAREKGCTEDDLFNIINVFKPKESRIYSFPMFTPDFCCKFLEEIENFENSDIPKTRPNSMNRYGVSLSELGFDHDFLDPLRIKYLRPICTILFPDWGGDCLDSHKAFIVKYKISEDRDLNYHFDNAEVTLNVSLNTAFTGGSLYFGEMRDQVAPAQYVKIEQQPMSGLLHRGQQRHGAEAITSGERYNLIVWMRSSKIRNLECPMCGKKPQLVQSLGYGDGYTITEDENNAS